jgi:hypothetical protein
MKSDVDTVDVLIGVIRVITWSAVALIVSILYGAKFALGFSLVGFTGIVPAILAGLLVYGLANFIQAVLTILITVLAVICAAIVD